MTEQPAADPATPPADTATAQPDQETMALKDLARGVLDRSIRPRTTAVRRLAEAVLAKGEGKPAKKKKDGKKSRKLATIPGQKGKKKA